MTICYKKERDENFYQVCEQIRSSHKGYISCAEIAAEAINHPARSFFLDFNSIACIIFRMRIGHFSSGRKFWRRRLYIDIWLRYIWLRKQTLDAGQRLSVIDIATIISEQPVPRFYLSPTYATTIYYQQLNKHRNEKRTRI
jgi:hypothetical protein